MKNLSETAAPGNSGSPWVNLCTCSPRQHWLAVGVLGTGVPRLACLRPAAWLEWGPNVAHLHQHKAQDPREGPSLARRTTRSFLQHGLLRLAREEAEKSRRVPHEVSMTQAKTTGGARRAPARAVS